MLRISIAAMLLMICGVVMAAKSDLNPVTFKQAPKHPPVELVRDGQAKAAIVLLAEKPSRVLTQAVQEMQTCITLATGATLPIVKAMPDGPAIVIGDCAQAAEQGLVGKDMPVEGFAIKTAPNAIFIVGHDEKTGPRSDSDGTAWGVYEFCERFVGVRWYWPADRGGRSILPAKDLVVKPVWLTDAPVFRFREIWPASEFSYNASGHQLGAQHAALRSANSWPINLVVHSPNWSGIKEYTTNRPEVYQLNTDGTRNFQMLCYGNPKTLDTYLELMAQHFDGKKNVALGIVGDTVTVSPNDMEVCCYCPDCRKLWDANGGQYGTASRVMANFVQRLATATKARWPQVKILYLPYMNYTAAPQGVTFPGNVYIQLCGMPGLAQYKEPAIQAAEEANLKAWAKISGHPVQNWHYDCWPEDKTKAVYQYPHVVKQYYQRNRKLLVGSFINGVTDHWPRQNLTLYCWMKVLWNPDFDVDTAMDEYCRRMYGPAAASMRELLRLQVDGWEKSRWPDAMLSPKAIYATGYPKATLTRMQELLAQAAREAGDDAAIKERIDYIAKPFPAMIEEYESVIEGKGMHILTAKKVGEKPVIDGKLDDAVWEKATPMPLINFAGGQEIPAKYPTEVRAVWTADGIAFGLKMSEPTPTALVRNINSRDVSDAWWNDNVEIFLDVTGKNAGDYYQFILNPNAALYDSRSDNVGWNVEKIEAKAFTGPDYWSLEVFLPYTSLPNVLRPGTGVEWFCQVTRHRLADYKTNPLNPREYTRLNARFGGGSANLANFAPLRFIE